MNDVALAEVFARRAEQWVDRMPVAAAAARTVGERRDLAAPVENSNGPLWGRPHVLLAGVTALLRAEPEHPLTRYWATLGGHRAPDTELPGLFADFVTDRIPELTARCGARPAAQCDPLVQFFLWPAVSRAAAGRRIALVELGGAAGFGLLLDRSRYRVADRVHGDSGPLYRAEWRGAGLGDVAPLNVVDRHCLDRQPIRHDDRAAVGWLRDCLLPDDAEKAAMIDEALTQPALADIQWHTGDYFVTLPQVLAAIPPDRTPVVYGAHTLCCAENPRLLPALLAAAGRDLVWVAKEHPDHALGLVSDETIESGPNGPPILLTAAHYRAGELTGMEVLAEADGWNAWLDWGPRPVAVR